MDREHPDSPAAPGVVELSVTIAATPAEVWRALTDPERMEPWLGDFRMLSTWEAGGPIELRGRLEQAPHAETGTLLEIEPQRLLRFEHWSALWRVPDAPDKRAVMSIRLEPVGDATRVWLRHELPAVEAIVPHSRFFWSVSLERLRRWLGG